MDRDSAKRHAKAQLESYLKGEGINTNKNFRCLNPSHEDKDPSMNYDKVRQRVHCFGCGVTYDIFDLIGGLRYGMTDHKDKFDKTYEHLRITVDDQYQKKENYMQQIVSNQKKEQSYNFKAAQDNLNKTNYPAERGLSSATCEYFKLGFDENFKTTDKDEVYTIWQALIIPTGEESFAARNTNVNAHKKERIRKRGASTLFNLEAFKGNKPIFICEGEIDAMSFHEIGFNAVALGSTSNYNQLVQYLKDNKPVQPLLLALDNDERGKEITSNLKAALKYLKITSCEAEVYDQYHDANEALV